VAPVLEINAPLDGSSYGWWEQLPGEAKAYDPDNVDPDTCLPIGDFVSDNGTGITQVQFRIDYIDGGYTVHEQNQFSVLYCAFTGTPTCLTQSLGSPFEWPNDTPISTGDHKLYARAKDDEGVWSEWEHVEFTIDVDPTPTPSLTPTPSDTPVPSPVPSCSMITITNFSGFGGNDLTWDIVNTNGTPVDLDNLQLTWPSANGNLQQIEVEGSYNWSDIPGDSPTSTNRSISGSVAAGNTKQFRLGFENSTVNEPHTMILTFAGLCDKTVSVP
jgi:hypothetical protein